MKCHKILRDTYVHMSRLKNDTKVENEDFSALLNIIVGNRTTTHLFLLVHELDDDVNYNVLLTLNVLVIYCRVT